MTRRNRLLIGAGVAALALLAGGVVTLAIMLSGARTSASQANATASQTSQKLSAISRQLGALKGRDAAPKAAANSANAAHLGLCWTPGTSDSTGYMTSGGYLDSPQLINGVVQCPSGTFVPVTPQQAPSGQ
jgi:hypothetical protein